MDEFNTKRSLRGIWHDLSKYGEFGMTVLQSGSVENSSSHDTGDGHSAGDRNNPFSRKIKGIVRSFNGDDEASILKRKAINSFAIRIVSAGIIYLMQIALARMAGAEQYGIFALVWVWTTLLGSVTCLGFNTSIVRFLPRYLNRGSYALARGFVRFGFWISFCGSTLIASLGILGLYFFGNHVTTYYVIPFYLAFICLPIVALGEIEENIAISRSWINLALIPSFIMRPLIIFIATGTLWFYGMDMTASVIMACAIGACWIIYVGQVVSVRFSLRKELPTGKCKYLTKPWISISAPLFVADSFYILSTNADILILGLLLGPGEVAIYYAAIKTLAMVSYFHFAVASVSARPFADLFARKAPVSELNTLYARSVKMIFFPALATTGFMLLIGPYVLELFGDGFSEGYPLMAIIACGLVIQAAAGPMQYVLTMAGKERFAARASILSLGINVSLNFFLIPIYGLPGAAVATAISMAGQSLYMLFIAHRELGLKPFPLFRSTSTS